MKVAFFSAHDFERTYYDSVTGHDIHFFSASLHQQTLPLAQGFEAISCFASDKLDATVLSQLAAYGVKLITLRSAGFNHVDLKAAKAHGLIVTRVPCYSPYAVAEHAVGLILSLNRHIHHAYARVQSHNFKIDGFTGFDLKDKTVGIIGVGNIGAVFAQIMSGFGCHVLVHDIVPQKTYEQVSAKELYQRADIISLHVPLSPNTHHMIDETALAQMKPGVMLINTSRGGLLDTKAIIDALKKQHIGYLGIDVYEEEEHLFFEDHSLAVLQDDDFARLQTFPNVLITAHQAFLTHEALSNIAQTTLANLNAYAQQAPLAHVLTETPS